MGERKYGTQRVLYGVVETPDGRIQVRVYHQNQAVRELIKKHSDRPSYFVEHLNSYARGDTRAKFWLARMVSDYHSQFSADQVDFVLEQYPQKAAVIVQPASDSGQELELAGNSSASTASLQQVGFVEVGQWRLDGTLKSGVRFALHDMADQRVIYAFTVDSELKYVGVCENVVTTLKDRMGRYQSMIGMTNERIAKRVKESLDRGRAAAIWAWKPQGDIQISGMRVDLVMGLENPLIRRFHPPWNIKG